MNKTELVEQIAQKADLSRRDAEQAVDAALKTIEEQLARGGEITLTGFGKFHVAERGARQGRNPQTGAPIQIAASRVPRFSAGSKLKESVKR
ncbi:MAG: HU family DNA-binding protein [Solirubrobacterales bacterium]